MLTTVAVTLDLLTKASKALDSIREQAKTSKDSALKDNISKLYDDFLDLKGAVLRVTEENAHLQAKIADLEKTVQPKIRQVGVTNYYYVGDEGPYCQPCYDSNRMLVHLQPRQQYAGGNGRKCDVCNKVFFEDHAGSGNTVKIYRG